MTSPTAGPLSGCSRAPPSPAAPPVRSTRAGPSPSARPVVAAWATPTAAKSRRTPAAATQAAELALVMCRTLGDTDLEVSIHVTLGNARLVAGDVAGAQRAHGDGLRLQQALGEGLYEASAMLHAARSAVAAGDPAAVELARKAGDIVEAAGIEEATVDARTLQAVATGDRALLKGLPDGSKAMRVLVATARAAIAGRPAPEAAQALAPTRFDVRFLAGLCPG